MLFPRNHVGMGDLFYRWGHTGFHGPCCCPTLCWCLRPIWTPIAWSTTRDHDDVHGSCWCQKPCWCVWPELWPKAILMLMDFTFTKDHDAFHGLCCIKKLCWCPWFGLLLETMFSSVIFVCITNEGYFDVHVADGDHVEIHGLCCTWNHADFHGVCYLWRPGWYSWAVLLPEAVLMFVVYAAARGHVDICGLCCKQGPW